jgi:hypothetical protein
VLGRPFRALGVACLLPVGLLAAGASSASADPGMTVAVGTSTLTARVLLTVQVVVVCDPLLDPNTFSDSVSVTVQQASGQSIITGSGQVAGGSGSPFGGGGFLTCDGSTQNLVDVNIVPSAPFHGGPAIFTVSASHTTGSCNPFCQITGSESARLGPTSMKIKG